MSHLRTYTIVNVSNISAGMTDARIREMFEKYGKIASHKIMNPNDAVYHRFAYVAFEDSDDADEAVIELNGQKIDDDRIRVRRTRKKQSGKSTKTWAKKDLATVSSDKPTASSKWYSTSLTSLLNGHQQRCFHHHDRRDDGFSIFVKNLDRHVDAARLRIAFEPYGTILGAKIIMDGDGSKGYGFVQFRTKEEANRAINGMSGQLIGTKIVGVEMSRRNNRNADSVSRWFSGLGITDLRQPGLLRNQQFLRNNFRPSACSNSSNDE